MNGRNPLADKELYRKEIISKYNHVLTGIPYMTCRAVVPVFPRLRPRPRPPPPPRPHRSLLSSTSLHSSPSPSSTPIPPHPNSPFPIPYHRNSPSSIPSLQSRRLKREIFLLNPFPLLANSVLTGITSLCVSFLSMLCATGGRHSPTPIEGEATEPIEGEAEEHVLEHAGEGELGHGEGHESSEPSREDMNMRLCQLRCHLHIKDEFYSSNECPVWAVMENKYVCFYEDSTMQKSLGEISLQLALIRTFDIHPLIIALSTLLDSTHSESQGHEGQEDNIFVVFPSETQKNRWVFGMERFGARIQAMRSSTSPKSCRDLLHDYPSLPKPILKRLEKDDNNSSFGSNSSSKSEGRKVRFERRSKSCIMFDQGSAEAFHSICTSQLPKAALIFRVQQGESPCRQRPTACSQQGSRRLRKALLLACTVPTRPPWNDT
eukprot:759424-Hanusia_phi.AAC.8